MAELLSLRGRTALSSFRITKLFQALSAARPGHRIAGITATFWHFVEVARALTENERDRLDRLLTYGPRTDDAAPTGALLLVVPRPGTISPWSSKATDIAHNCGLDAVKRIERGMAYTIDSAKPGIAALIHDRMTETVLASFAEADKLFQHVPPRPLGGVPLDQLRQANARLGLAL